ncbi:vWA domain-containing protein [Spirochaeta africana]|uniref:VWFA domain-containing protein n=1 Tax=Spirochaeta africana (strain ATCC 700263 / DSM 8902 / Z-7692) TaxID=889378 RepID=H9UM28_SPIAZ|nr:VWA domain-containing protein [Spirochaeta africana]AFG38571.1 hypothetical protein Spiaf_2541 [Spirochaeta africana DSM 8902]
MSGKKSVWRRGYGCVVVCLLAVIGGGIHAMELTPDDVRIEESLDGGFYLYIRAHEDVGSVLIVESTEHPERAAASYALRDPGNHPANRGEVRLLDGEPLEETRGQSLVSSTIREDPEFGQAFRVFIPYITVYGYPWSRSGELEIRDGTYINIRTFALPFADYRGAFLDNPFRIRVTQDTVQQPTTPPTEDGPFHPIADETFSRLAEQTETRMRYVEDPQDITAALQEVLDEAPPVGLEIALVLDTTQSMYPYMPQLQQDLVPMLEEATDRFPEWRIGVVFFRDYMEEYLTRKFPMTDDMSAVQNYINRAVARGGRDIPEAVYEGLYAALMGYEWQAEERRIILVGDAPPHPRPRGHVDESMVMEAAAELGVQIHPVLVAPY